MANKKRLIDANAFWNRLNQVVYDIFTYPERPCDYARVGYYTETIETVLKQTKTVDAVEVVRGRWNYYHKQNIAVCTNCSFERNLDENFGKAVSCPNCGAKMDGDGNG